MLSQIFRNLDFPDFLVKLRKKGFNICVESRDLNPAFVFAWVENRSKRLFSLPFLQEQAEKHQDDH